MQSSGDSKQSWEWWTTTFAKVIKASGRVVIVMTPFDDPTVAKRAWCLFEAVIAMREQVEILPVTPPSQRLLLRGKMLESDGEDVLINAMMRIDSSKAQATVPTDLERIQDLIKQSVPGQHVEVDNIFKNVIRAWIRGECSGLFETTFDAQSEDAARFAHNVGSLLDSVGDYPKALEFYNKDLAITKATHGENHISLAITYGNMGGLFEKQGEFDKAIQYAQQTLDLFRTTFGDDHPNTKKATRGLQSAIDAKNAH